MSTKRVNIILPEELILESIEVSKKNLTETIKDALEIYKRSKAYEYFLGRKGKLKIKVIKDLREDDLKR